MRKPVHAVKAGYTLTEMLVVIAVIGLIAAFIAPNLLGQLARARVKATELQLKNLSAAVTMYRDDTGSYPSEVDGLAALVDEPAGVEGWTGPYQDDATQLSDPWGRALIYDLDEEAGRYSITSFGADGREGGRGVDRDITAPARR